MQIPSPARVVLAGLLAVLCGMPALAQQTVHFANASHPTRCAEEDNVYVRVSGENITRFSITATHPAYLATLAEDSMAPDFSDCKAAHDPSYHFTPRDLV